MVSQMWSCMKCSAQLSFLTRIFFEVLVLLENCFKLCEWVWKLYQQLLQICHV